MSSDKPETQTKTLNKALPLAERQKLFCREYIIDLNATQAATRAGYSKKTAYSQGQRLLKKVEVQLYIQELNAKRAEKMELTADNVLRGIIDVRDNSMQVIAGEGAADVDVMINPQAALKAGELLGKHLNMFADRTEHTGPGGGAIQVESTVTFVDPSTKEQ